MNANLEEIKPIEVRGKTFLITVLKVSFIEDKHRLKLHKDSKLLLEDYYTAYVYLDHLTDKMESLGAQTHKKNKVIGVDTAHAHNNNTSLEEKKKDAYIQIESVIEAYLNLLDDIKEVVKSWD